MKLHNFKTGIQKNKDILFSFLFIFSSLISLTILIFLILLSTQPELFNIKKLESYESLINKIKTWFVIFGILHAFVGFGIKYFQMKGQHEERMKQLEGCLKK